MAEQGDHDSDSLDETPGYQPPAEKSLQDILTTDAEDQSLERYKQQLLGASAAEQIVLDADNPLNVIVKKLTLVVPDRPDMELDLTVDTDKKHHFILKEGCTYRVKISFLVQREIVSGLRYFQGTYRKGIRVDKASLMVGSYGPKLEEQSFIGPPDEAPSGMLARGSYTIKSKFTDDDKKIYKEWDWHLDIKKDWQ